MQFKCYNLTKIQERLIKIFNLEILQDILEIVQLKEWLRRG